MQPLLRMSQEEESRAREGFTSTIPAAFISDY
jgi:hypothetical protein